MICRRLIGAAGGLADPYGSRRAAGFIGSYKYYPDYFEVW
jgi:hypothetical protein